MIVHDDKPANQDPSLAKWPERQQLTRREWWGEVGASIVVVGLVMLSAILLMAILSE